MRAAKQRMWASVGVALLCFVATGLWMFSGHMVMTAVMSFAGAAWATSAVLNWRINHGSNRQAEAGSQDPDHGAYTVTFNAGGSFVAPARSISAAGTGPDLEVVESDQPILAQRAARLLFDGTSEHWGSLNSGGPWGTGSFGVEARAKCERPWDLYRASRSQTHSAPAVDCRCGFYAVPCDIEPWAESGAYVTLLVELSGTVIEHEKGYRASHQRVVECRIPPCRFCGGVATVVDVREAAMASACCDAHIPKADDQVLVTIADLSKLLPVPVTAADRSEATR